MRGPSTSYIVTERGKLRAKKESMHEQTKHTTKQRSLKLSLQSHGDGVCMEDLFDCEDGKTKHWDSLS